jgi:steroid delta-isomerase-like uncharacterized protein
MKIVIRLIGVVLLVALQSQPCAHDLREVERNKATARRIYEDGLSRGIFDVRYTPDFIGHGGRSTFTHEQGLAEAQGFRSAFPDLVARVDRIVAEGDFVVVRWTASGTNTGTGNGIPATGRSVTTSGTAIFRFENGAVAEEWTSGDTLGLLKQLGMLPEASLIKAGAPSVPSREQEATHGSKPGAN